MSFLYPRTISITRPHIQTGVGALPYGGLLPSTETAILSGIAASIQLKKEGGRPESALPSDASRKAYWTIFFKAALGAVQKRDIITDDLGIRYQITGDYWSSMGYSVIAEEMGA